MTEAPDSGSPRWPDDAPELLPAIVQDARTLQVLMLAYMSRASLERTLATGRVTFFSRSRDTLWTKGETSGNTLELVDLSLDCDRDTFLVRANPAGPTCHRGTTSCFDDGLAPGVGFLGHLARVVEERGAAAPEESYTARLLASGLARVAQKVGEEGVETVIAALGGDREELRGEAADLLYHLLVLLRASDVELEDVVATLRERHSG